MSLFAFGPSSSPSYSFPMLLIHSAFLLCSLGCHILLQTCFASFASGCWYVFVLSPLVGRIFSRCFEMSCFFCIVLPCLDTFLSSFFRKYLLIYFLNLYCIVAFRLCSNNFQRFSFVLSFLLVIVDFLSAFLVEFPIQILSFCSCF